jgi:2'-5' RNA ligase
LAISNSFAGDVPDAANIGLPGVLFKQNPFKAERAMHRLFVGLTPPAAIRRQLLGLMGGVPGARWQNDAQLHLTLRFIGEVDRRMAEDVAIALGHVRWPPVQVSLSGVGEFDKRGRTNAVWAGVRPHEALAALHRKIDQALIRAGLEPEHRAYLPHITLARMALTAGPTARFLADHAGLASEPFTLTHFTLFESTLGSDGPSYETVERYPLG